MMHPARLVGVISILLVGAACGDPEIVSQPTGGSSGEGASGQGGEGGKTDFATSSMATTSTMGGPCDGVVCDPGLMCEPQNNMPSCVAITCPEAMCGPTEECQILPNGGAICVDISCSDDVNCPVDQFCNGTICVDDTCIAGASTCMGDVVYECPSNGSALEPKLTCDGGAYFVSACVDDGMGKAFCGCQDDWDCPANTVCDVDQCAGTGVEPTCSLPPVPFTQLLPSPEIVWGGSGEASRLATGKPYEKSAQVVMTPLVINLDDDNGDGQVNERDFPEIVFMTFCDSQFTTNGVLRALHGGGPQKGADFFAVCGADVWQEGDALPTSCATAADNCSLATLNSTAALAAGDIDNDGLPEIVAITEGRGLQIHRADGTIALTTAGALWPSTGYSNPAPAIANVDNAGYAEVVVGRYVFTFGDDGNGNLVFVDQFSGSLMSGTQGQGPVPCVANLVGDTRQEIVAGTTVYAMPQPPAGATTIADCAMFPPSTPEETAFCSGQLLVAWDGQTVNGAAAIPNAQRDGFCAVADILGVDPVLAPSPTNPLDGNPEVVLINEGTLLVLEGATGTLRRSISLGAGTDGGAPNVDDFDGDGFPEVGSAFGTSYFVVDLQDTTTECPAWPSVLDDAISLTGPQSNPPRTPPMMGCATDADCEAVTPGTTCNETTAECICLHNGWKRKTEDDSSRVTGSSVFDFNGDGGAEVIYNDECFFRIYDGLTASVLFKEASESRTRIEYPVVADVDNDGNAEIVFATSNESGFCSVGGSYDYNNGIEVWGDPSDTWVSARRIWNEHAYHVTNVTEGGSILAPEPESWKVYNGRIYDTYRSNPRSYGIAPDLVVGAVQFSSVGDSCGALGDVIDITFEIANVGDLRVGPGIVIQFEGTWNALSLTETLYADLATMTPLEVVLQSSLEPGDSILLTVTYDATQNTPGTLPDVVNVIADATSAASECNETNNELAEPVVAPNALADLRIELGAVTGNCPPTVATTVFNDGTVAVVGVIVRYYAGDPNQGGSPIVDVPVPGTIPAGGSVMLSPTLMGFPSSATGVTIFAIVDPDNAIPECNDGNNKDAAAQQVSCGPS